MRTYFVLALTFSLLFITSFTQKKHEQVDQLSKVDRLYLTCKVWGYLKYYHPMVGKGSFDWDDKLQKLLNSTNNIQTYADFSSYLARWIYYLGPLSECTTCKQRSAHEPFLENFDLSWTQSDVFTEELKKSLKNIENNRYQGNHHYVGKGNIEQFEPKNEQQYFDLNWQDENQRLLPLFRYWNYIEYFYPYKYQTDQPWDDVLREMIPQFLAAETKLDFHLAMLEMVVKVDDSHAGLITPVLDELPYYNYLPARFEMVENKAVITEIIDAQKAKLDDLQVGDVFTKVNGRSVKDLHDDHKKYIWGSNESVKDRSIYHTLFMGINESPNVTIERDGATRTAALTLYKYSDLSYAKSSPKAKWTTPDDSIGYVNMGELGVGDVDAMMGELMEKTVIIFDLRNNPKGTYQAISRYLNPSDTTFAIYTKPDFSYPGKFFWQGQATCGEENPNYFQGKVILLVNENTQSHAEFTCMCLQTAPNVVTIGSQTAGTDGAVSKFPIYAQLYTSISGIGVYYPNKKETQRVGIVPDIYVRPTVAGIRAGKDEVLESALEVAREEIASRMAEELARQAKESLKRDTLQMEVPKIDAVEMDSSGIDTDGKG